MTEERSLRVRLDQRHPIPLAAKFHCRRGEVLALLGPSGGGKSTILRCIAGLHRPAAGRVDLDGTVWLDTAAGIDLRPQARAVGFVFQEYALFPNLDALGNVAAAVPTRDAAAREARARELLERVNLAGLEHRKPARLSGGQRQRVAVARALAREPKVLLLDEPFSAVDQVTRRRLHGELLALRRDLEMPVVLVTHHLDEATLLADRLAVLHHGRTLQTGTPAEVLTRPASAQVARLADLRNVFAATVVGHDADRGVTRIAWGGRELEAAPAPAFAPGDAVDWVIPPARVLLHRRDRPSRGDRENPFMGRVRECVPYGAQVNAVIALDGADGAPGAETVTMLIPEHAAARNGLAAGALVGLSLVAEAIHLMAPETAARPETPG